MSPSSPDFCSIFFLLAVYASSCHGNTGSFEFASVQIFPDISGRGLVNVHIDTPSKHYDIRMHKDAAEESPFAADFEIVEGNEHFSGTGGVEAFSGDVVDFPNSRAIGSINGGRFEGILFLNQSSGLALFIEDARYFSHVNCSQDPFHKDPENPQYCTIAFIDADDPEPVEQGSHWRKRSADNHASGGMCGWSDPQITERLLASLPERDEDMPLERNRRTADATPKFCSLYVQIDWPLWNLYLNDYSNNKPATRTALTQLVSYLVTGVTAVYKSTSFVTDDGTAGPFTNFRFQVNRIRILTKDEVCSTNPSPDPKALADLCQTFIDSDDFLKINSKINHDDSCLAYIITHRQFTGGVMGLAWLGYPRGYVGGVCQRATLAAGGTASYNTGIITSNNQGARVSKRQLMLTMAHEIGHNFGSPHDSTPDCADYESVHGQPSSSSGNYIMFPYVNPGDKQNNDKFSFCSRNKIAMNIDAVLANRGGKVDCFASEAKPYCGNQIIEGNEVCDCGETQEECTAFGDNCCTPGRSGQNGCKLKPTSTCSPSMGPCCDGTNCNYMSATTNFICLPAGECSAAAACDGTSSTCPTSSSKANGTRCFGNTRQCVNGECQKSICAAVGYEECQEPMQKGVDPSRYCYLSCKPPGGQECLNSLDSIKSDPGMLKLFTDPSLLGPIANGQPFSLPPGTPCDQYRGVCDVFHKCRQVNVQGPLARIFATLSGKAPIESASQWLVRYWYVVAIGAAVFISICFIALKYCSNLLPTSNPKFQGSMSVSEAAQEVLKPNLFRRRKRNVPATDS